MLYLKIIAVGLCSAFAWDAAVAAEACSNTTIKIEYVRRNGKNVMVARGKCCKGYSRHKNKCNPVCATPCENSRCTAPNFCTCDTGFERLSDFRCIPHCDGCDNGFCIKPGYCQCNSGFYHAENGSCLIECNNCVGGFCTEPNVCQCPVGYVLNELSGSSRSCEPVCLDGCPNGICVSPGECKCNEGFIKGTGGNCLPERPSTTTPEPCEQGYEDIEGVCTPICLQTCVNGKCMAPNQCECDEGFDNANTTANHICEPVCRNGCQNGDCIAPGKCMCHRGYGKIAEECIPLCEKCSFGHCVEPEVCVCDRGYELVDGDCVPICEEECKNAKCTGPNSCTCLPGYNYTDINSLFECLPVCEDDCDNGECVAPNTCECNSGFVKEDNQCVDEIELCRSRCFNGYCDENVKCNCHYGYIMNLVGLCEKTCPEGCSYGQCIGGECICEEGYRLSANNASICEPICEDEYDEIGTGCINGQCVSPNICLCDAGFELVDGSRTHCESQEILRRHRERQLREQLCAKHCNNGVCDQGYCQCKQGYVNPDGEAHRCIPMCDPQCKNATCVLPNRCECDLGYKFYNGSLHTCLHVEDINRIHMELMQAQCEEKCIYGNCLDGKCLCNEGFRLSKKDEFICQPHCDNPCSHGVCSGNNRCQCFEGYRSVANGSGCEPICEPECLNGLCVSPNECKCLPGHSSEPHSKHKCESETTKQESVAREKQRKCKSKCVNGICIEGVCKCYEGYSTSPESKMICEPICTGECVHGKCVAPESCSCEEGYELVPDQGCKPMCNESCVNGFCSAPGRCDCLPGYKLLAEDDDSCVPDCGPEGCRNGHCVAPDSCICFTGYQPNKEDDPHCELIPDIIYKADSHSDSLLYSTAYIKYLAPVVVVAILTTAAIITMIVLRNKKKDYHIGKLETKENCVYFMPQALDADKDEEEKFSV
ncbi:fibrillin-2-like isoform X2 [Uranotaenia lowii]|uniref:fibrillin-2-like isoform X2 n=1 Tax=Uranotaenia lowii TaxID=190385 RepID=UPI002479421C|nr:fibrillin-2-like isoform X2 [Uranotaenia lowii]